jgi:hypothetical protein
MLTRITSQLGNAAKIDHRVFPLATEDDDIIDTIESIEGCKVKKIMHGETANHVWYWVPDNQARAKSAELIAKLRGRLAPIAIKDVSRYTDMTDEELELEEQRLNDQLRINAKQKTNK